MDARVSGNLGEILLREGLITPEQLLKAEREHQVSSKPLARVLVEMDIISEKVKLGILQKKLGIEIVSLRNFRLDAQLAARVPKGLASRHAAVPIRVDPDGLVVAMDDPSDLDAVDKLSAISNMKVKTVLAPYPEIELILQGYPEEEATEEALPVVGPSFLLKVTRTLTFWVFLLAPLIIFFGMLYASQDFQRWFIRVQRDAALTVFDIALYFLLLWGTWSMLVYYVHDVVFGYLMGEEEEEAKE